ncbi:hypothetical protein BDW74DRAFT_20294 [Aspergillus multicolor]|uniref:uncharacterized protein n=1 Tax=Aspergillus multicolor TaxID=41759 RepID=UPI003CCCAFED
MSSIPRMIESIVMIKVICTPVDQVQRYTREYPACGSDVDGAVQGQNSLRLDIHRLYSASPQGLTKDGPHQRAAGMSCSCATLLLRHCPTWRNLIVAHKWCNTIAQRLRLATWDSRQDPLSNAEKSWESSFLASLMGFLSGLATTLPCLGTMHDISGTRLARVHGRTMNLFVLVTPPS